MSLRHIMGIKYFDKMSLFVKSVAYHHSSMVSGIGLVNHRSEFKSTGDFCQKFT